MKRGVSGLPALALALIAGVAASARAQPLPPLIGQADDEPEGPATVGLPEPDAAVLIGPDTAWRWQPVAAPILTRQLAVIALAGLDVAAGRRADGALTAGELPAAPAPWPRALPPDVMLTGPTPLATVLTSGGKGPVVSAACECRTAIARGADERIALLRGEAHFALPDEAATFTSLELRLRFRDGIAVWINGLEVARRGLAKPGLGAPADRRHGPEWERFAVPIAPGLLHAGENTLTIELRPIGDEPGVSLDATLTGRRGPRIVLGPMLQQVDGDRARVVIETDVATDAAVAWGATAALGTTIASPLVGRRHVFSLTGLPRGVVHYQVSAGDARSSPASFHTAPGAGEVMRIALYGDVRGGHRIHAELLQAMLREAPDLVIATGDLVLRGTDLADWQQFFAVTQPMLSSVPYYPAVGNHDLGRAGDDRRPALGWFDLPPPPPDRPLDTAWYSFDLADVHLVMLDSNAYDRVEQASWLEADLTAARARGVRAIVVATHDGPYSRGSHRGNRTAQRIFAPILGRHHVTLVAAGHDHLYQRGQAPEGFSYVVTGGGGASLYSVACGVPGRRDCTVDDGMLFTAKEHHFVMLTIYPRRAELCARRADGSLLEPCVELKL